MSFDAEQLRSLMRLWTTGVTPVTSRDGHRVHGTTVSSFTSAPLDPTTVLVSLENTTNTHRMVQESGVFAVSILEVSQADPAEPLASRVSDGADRFPGVPYETVATGSPIPAGCLGYVDRRVVSSHVEGTHTHFTGRVVAGGIRSADRPLLYYSRGYRRLAR